MSIVATKTVNELLSTQSHDHAMMAIALTLGRRGLGRTWPNPAVGAVVVRDSEAGPIVVGRGWTQAGGRPHAEVEALRRAGEAARDATLYVTLEPCSHHGKSPPCVDAIIAAGVRRVVSSIEDPNENVSGAGHQRLRDAGIKVEIGEGAAQARRDHAGHIRRMRDSRPHVILKLALSADDKIGLPGRRIAITGERARDRVHLLRAQCDAVLIGIGTAIADDPLLTCRLPGLGSASPVRIVLDPNLRLPPTSRLAQTARVTPVWVLASSDADSNNATILRESGIEILTSPIRNGHIDLQAALALLSDCGITRLLVEGGARVAADFVAHDLVDEAHLYRATMAIGADGIDALAGMPIAAITQSPRFIALESETIGDNALQHFERPT